MAAPTQNAAVAGAHQSAKWRLAGIAGFAALTAAVIAGVAVLSLSPKQPAAAVTRVLVGVSPAGEVARALRFPNARPFRAALALSPDGQTLVFVGAQTVASTTGTRASRQLYRRTMDRLEATPIEGTEGAESPFL